MCWEEIVGYLLVDVMSWQWHCVASLYCLGEQERQEEGRRDGGDHE